MRNGAVTHFPCLRKDGGPVFETRTETYLAQCWMELGEGGEAWVPLGQLDANHPTCLICIGLGP
jgi:hypothetical protein